jgi:hypothetical protein
MSYDNAKACAVVETTDVGQNIINVDQKPHQIQPEVILPASSNFQGKNGQITCLYSTL